MSWQMTAVGTADPPAAVPGRIREGSDQQEALWRDLLANPGHKLWRARAGCGKTSSFREGAWRLREAYPGIRITMVAFNAAIAEDNRQGLPPGVQSVTMHALGRSVLASCLGIRGEPHKYKKYDIVDSFLPRRGRETRPIKAAIVKLASLCQGYLLDGKDPSILWRLSARHGINVSTPIIDELVPKVLERCLDQVDVIDFDDMIWLPVMLGLPFPAVDVLGVDEAQDLSPSQHRFVELALGDGTMVLIGDDRQCQPEGTMVAMTGGGLKPIEKIRVGDEVISFDRHSAALVGRDRQGRKVTALQRHLYFGDLLTVGAGGKQTRCTPDHKWLVRFTSRDTDLWATYLMKQGDRFRVGWCQLFSANGDLHLGQRARIERADAAWILGIHRTKSDASATESIIAAIFGLPTIQFWPNEMNALYTREFIDKVFDQLARADLPRRAEECLRSFGRSIEHPFYRVNRSARLGRTTIFVTQACNLIPEIMAIPVNEGGREPLWLPIEGRLDLARVESRPANGLEQTVYCLQVEGNETYIADGLVTHNSIYSFRGADCRSLDTMADRLKGTTPGLAEFPLTRTRRCPRSHVDLARSLVPDFEALPDAPGGRVDHSEDLGRIAVPGLMALCRTNAPLLSACYGLIGAGIPVAIQGRSIGEGLVRLIESLAPASVPNLLRKAELHRAAETARLAELENGEGDVAELNDQVDALIASTRGCSAVAEVVRKIESLFVDLKSADASRCVVLSSVHRAKGREADHVAILRPDLIPHPSAGGDIQEENLAYVAATRARKRLSFLGPIPDLFD